MARSLVGLSGRRRVAGALGAGVLAGSLALAGCSSSSPKGGGTIPQHRGRQHRIDDVCVCVCLGWGVTEGLSSADSSGCSGADG